MWTPPTTGEGAEPPTRFATALFLTYNTCMLRTILSACVLLVLMLSLTGCGDGDNPITPPGDNPDLRISLTRLNPNHPIIDSVVITITRMENGKIKLPGRTIDITASSGDVGNVTDRGDGTYEAIWTGSPAAEVKLVASDPDTDPLVQSGITFIALDYLLPEWDVPIKLEKPISTDGWETAPFLYPDGKHLAFAYITLDMVALAAGIPRPIGEERPGQSVPQTLDIYIAERPDGPSWWTGWTVENARANTFQSLPMHLSAPSLTSDGQTAFCTVQEFDGTAFEPTTLYTIDTAFAYAPTPIGPPVDMTGLGEDNPYFDSMHGWLYFDTYDLGDPLSKQNIWAAQSLGGGQFDDPVALQDLNTKQIETQAFMHEPTGMLYFASDRGKQEFQLAIWRSSVLGSMTGVPERVAEGALALGRPSITYDGEWFCFVYARMEPGGTNADIAMSRRIE